MNHWFEQRREAAIEHLRQSHWLRHVEWLDEIDSTNSHARRLLAAGWDRWPALWVADRQTAGRGRTTRQWWSPEGCLMCSLLVGEEQLPSDASIWPQLSLIVGVAAAQAVEAEVPGVNVHLKWPNDLYLLDRKLAGILVEALPRSGDGRMAMVIGIGLNVAVDWSGADEEIRRRACSLAEVADTQVSVESMLIRLMESLQYGLAAWRSGQSQWWQEWSARSLLNGRTVHLRLPGEQQLVGECHGIDAAGRLLIQDAQQHHRIQSAEVVAWS
jgi:BirA family biotin operon repressor/biotin-[acetyl-CoA-carboxylase] ligase